jgi:branched-subunit amino acid transport protein
MVVVLDRQRAFVMKDRLGLGKAYTPVLEFVGCVLAFVLLNFE